MIDQIDLDMRSDFLAVRDQGARPTCLAHAVSAAHEHARKCASYLSPEYLHYFAHGGSSGNSITEIATALEAQGQCDDGSCPYFASEPPIGWKPPLGLHVYRRFSGLVKPDFSTVEKCAKSGHPPILGISLPEPFFDPQPPWVISPIGRIRGLHAVICAGIGWHGGSPVALIRNSWGADWADKGYAWLDEVFLGQHLKEMLLLRHEVVT
jgi:hypothetical protein